MRIERFFILCLLSFRLFALEISFYGPCLETPLLKKSVTLETEEFVGDLTISTLESEGISYLGSRSHLQSAFGTLYGMDAMEVLSDTAMRSHGWCFNVNEQSSLYYPDQVKVKNNDKITWYYCYVEYDSGHWANTHEWTNTIKPEQFCSNIR